MSGMNTNNGNIVGRLTRDPDLKYSAAGDPYCKFGIAQDSGFGEAAKPMFFNVTAFGKNAENIQKHFQKGHEIALLYRLDYESWLDKNTQEKRSAVGLIVIQWGFVSGRRRDDDDGSNPERDDFADRETAPARQAPQPARTAPAPQRPPTTKRRTPPPPQRVAATRPLATTGPGIDDDPSDPFADE